MCVCVFVCTGKTSKFVCLSITQPFVGGKYACQVKIHTGNNVCIKQQQNDELKLFKKTLHWLRPGTTSPPHNTS